MTPAEHAYRIALLAYPASYRRERGLEILTTILDGGEERWPRVREMAAIVAGGITRRGKLAGGGTRVGSLRAGVRLAVFAWLWPLAVVEACWALYPAIGGQSISGGLSWWRGAIGAVLALAPLGALTRSWWSGPLVVQVAGVALSGIGVPYDARWPWQATNVGQASVMFALGFVPGIACVLARPRAGEPRDARSPLWVPGAVVFGAVLASQGLFFSSWLGRPIAVVLVAGLVLARRDPRLAVGGMGIALLAAADRLANPAGYDPTWLGTGSLFSVVLIAYALAACWRLRPAIAT